MRIFYIFLTIFPIFLIGKTNDDRINPLYAGPLMTPSATNLDPGSFFIQPYVFFTDSTKHYSSSWHKTSGPETFNIISDTTIQIGLNKFLDITFDISKSEIVFI